MFWNKTQSKEQKQEALQQKFISEFSELIDNSNNDTLRGQFQNALSGGFDFGDILHQIYEDFGYPETLAFPNFWNMYRRFGVASAVCNIPVNITWMDNPVVKGGGAFDSQFEQLADKLKLWKRLKGLDSRQRVGRYAGLFMRVKDGKQPSEPMQALSSINQIVSITPLYEGQLKVSTTDSDPTSESFGEPSMYDFQSSTAGNRDEKENITFQIHPSRVIIAAEGADDGSIYGIPALENIYNDLMDLRKIAGAGGEGFYQNTRNAPVINTKEGYQPPTTAKQKEALETQLDEFLNKWRKKFVTSGLEFNYPNIKLDSPKDFADVCKMNIAAGSMIPAKLIFGNQSGVKAGDQDGDQFMTLLNSRRENFASEVIESVVEWAVKWNVIAPPSKLEIEWEDLLTLSDLDKLELSKLMADTNQSQFRAGGEHVFSPEQIAEIAGYELEKIELPSEDLPDDEELEEETMDEELPVDDGETE
jgi:uncharacterized protein